ncbi:MAG: glycosyltransferase family 4 protein [Candidatus Andersenbacteria bacterium]|nr:glycosyltransferase family 4 protein [Candidatus Andersenbacteria bacterium]
MKIAYLTNSSPRSGVGSYAAGLRQALLSKWEKSVREYSLLDTRLVVEGEEKAVISKWPGFLGVKSVNWIRLGRQLPAYLSDEDLVHATNQTLSFIRTDKPMVVTVHDIIELLEPQDKKAHILNRYLLSGIPKAAHIIAVSHYTKKTIQEYYGLSAGKITVIPNGIDTAIFHPIDNFSQTIGYAGLCRELKVTSQQPIVLYIGSDHLRKNVIAAVQAFAKFKEKQPQAVFIKVGEPGLPAGRQLLLEEIDRLKLRESVRFVGSATEDRLNEIYNLADVFMFPSTFEGFGLPPLQAMAAGTPVVCANATSLPEVVGEAALLHDPNDVAGFADSLLRLTQDEELKQTYRTAGLAQAKKFLWPEVALMTEKVYQSMINK